MPAKSWAIAGHDREYLFSKVAEWSASGEGSKPGSRSESRRNFLERLYKEYDEKFPGRIASFDLPGAGTGGSQVERRKAMIVVYGVR
jgi:hypothetical protein